MSPRPAYFRVLATFARNSLVRDMAFRGNFLIETFTTIAWAAVNLAFYVLIFSFTSRIGEGWGKYQFFMFFGTGLLVNSLVMTLFMTNLDELSELIRTGALDFALLKPIDAQFLISLRRIDWSSLANFVVGLAHALLRAGPRTAGRERPRLCSIPSTSSAAWPSITVSCWSWRRPACGWGGT